MIIEKVIKLRQRFDLSRFGIDGRWFIYERKVVFQKPRFSELKFGGGCKVLLTCVLSALEAKGHNGCETCLAQMVDKTPELILDSVLVMREFSNVIPNDVLCLL